MKTGVNYNPLSKINHDAARMLDIDNGAEVVRIVLTNKDGDWQVVAAWCRDASLRGAKVLGVITLATFAGNLSFHDGVMLAKERFGAYLWALEVGNEWDQISPSSWPLAVQTLNNLLIEARLAFPDITRYLGGAVSGQPDRLGGVNLSLVQGIALHPYIQRVKGLPHIGWGAGNVEDLIADYRRKLDSMGFRDFPIVITEFGGAVAPAPGAVFHTETERANYLETFLDAMEELGITLVVVFAYHNDVEGFGLVDNGGVANQPTYAKFYLKCMSLRDKEAASEPAAPTVEPPVPEPAVPFDFGTMYARLEAAVIRLEAAADKLNA